MSLLSVHFPYLMRWVFALCFPAHFEFHANSFVCGFALWNVWNAAVLLFYQLLSLVPIMITFLHFQWCLLFSKMKREHDHSLRIEFKTIMRCTELHFCRIFCVLWLSFCLSFLHFQWTYWIEYAGVSRRSVDIN